MSPFIRTLVIGTVIFAVLTLITNIVGWEGESIRRTVLTLWPIYGLVLAYHLKQFAPRSTPPAQRHPAAGRFCHICGSDALKAERCDAGLHS